MYHKSEQIMYAVTLIVLIGCLFYIGNLRDTIKEQAKVINDLEFVVLEKNFDLAESKRQNAVLEDNEYFYPVDRPVITSEIGMRISPITGKERTHYGTDMYSNFTMNVYAVRDGIVINHWLPPNKETGHKGHDKFGGYIEIVDSNGMSVYGHLSETFVREYQEVKAGDIIGIIGETGLSVGKHLHFAYFLNIFQNV